MSEDAEERPDEIRREIAKLIEELASLKEEEQCFITAWAVVYEATSMDLEQENAALRGCEVPTHQLVSASSGLGRFLQQMYDARWES